MNLKTLLLGLSSFAVIGSFTPSTQVKANFEQTSMGLPQIEMPEADPGTVVDMIKYNTLEYNGDKALPKTPVLLSSGVQRYYKSENQQYYAKGATTVVESVGNKDFFHKTTVTLEKRGFFGTTTYVSGSRTGYGEVWAESGTTPNTEGSPYVYWSY